MAEEIVIRRDLQISEACQSFIFFTGLISEAEQKLLDPGRAIFFPINAPGMVRFKLFDLVGYS